MVYNAFFSGESDMRLLDRRLGVLATCLLFSVGGAMAQEYPNRVVRIVVADTPGSGSDVVMRFLAQKLPYDSLRDFAPMTQITTNHFALVVAPSLPATSVAAFVKLATARPGEAHKAPLSGAGFRCRF